MGKKDHAPSAYRKLIKASKSGKMPVEKLIEEARALSEPYYQSLALFGLSMDKGLDNAKASELRSEALKLVEKEQRPWRRAELITSICKTSKGVPVSIDIIKLIGQIPEPKARAEAISGTVKYLGCENSPKLLEMAVKNQDYEAESCKPVIKFWVKECQEFENMLDILDNIKDQQAKIRLFGYLQLQLVRSRIQSTEPIEMAIELAGQLQGQERLSVLKDLASQSEDIESLEAIVAAITGLETPIYEASLLTSLAGSADKAGQKELALDWFNSAFECLTEIDNPAEAASIRLNLAIGYQRLGQEDLAQQNFQLSMDGAKGNEKLMSRVQKAMGHAVEKKPEPVIQKSNRNVLALHDTYEGKLSPIHIRMIARAAPLCIAYGLDLALLEFPIKDLNTLAKKVSADTNVGKGGRYLKELIHENRILLINKPDEAGLAIATTSHPDRKKAISLEDARKKVKSHPQKRLCVIMGLGRKGLPKKLLDSVPHHAEITGSNVSLETSTAMGIIAQMIGKL
ncbi:MAG: DUF531 family protein [Thermoplasmata archaeon]|nr:DUF531 family protein [Thermoplasmata archaeon]MCK5397452.1 DUF531 family protein [Thermoplasmata archaeon]